MNLHRTKRAQWSDIPPEKRNHWQKIAAASHSVITPANIVSVVGASMVAYGLYAILHNDVDTGIIAVVLGRIADIADGYIAEYTATKSPLGEMVDATLDKLALACALVVLLLTGTLPLAIGFIMSLHGIYNSLVSVAALGAGLRLHPSELGKYATGAAWLCVTTYLCAERFANGATHVALLAVGVICFIIYLGLAIISSLGYSRQYATHRTKPA